MDNEPSEAGFFSFENLEVDKLAIKYGVAVYLATEEFPDKERYNLTSQLRRAASCVAFNITEGKGRGTDSDFARLLFISRGSLLESVSALHLANGLGFIKSDAPTSLRKQAS
jgi:four helix bundle protein